MNSKLIDEWHDRYPEFGRSEVTRKSIMSCPTCAMLFNLWKKREATEVTMNAGLTKYNWKAVDRLLAMANKEQLLRISELAKSKVEAQKNVE